MKRYKISISYLPEEFKGMQKRCLPERIVESYIASRAIYLYLRYFKVINCSWEEFTSPRGPVIKGKVFCEEINK